VNILVTGATGFVGSTLVKHLEGKGHEIVRLHRGMREPGGCGWNPERGEIDIGAAGSIDAVVHLAGENIAARRWTPAQKDRIRHSRVNGTRLLAETIAALKDPPRVFVSASAIGVYGDRGEETLTEASAPGIGFLPDLCTAWEAATQPAEAAGVRVVHARVGIVLGAAGGALKNMLTPFKVGVGGKLGNGRQFMSWVTLQDLVRMVVFAVDNASLSGPVNMVSPGIVTNAAFTRALGRVIRRPVIFPMPVFAARMAFGEMANALLLASARVSPAKLLEAGFLFEHTEIEGALRAALNHGDS